MARSGSRIRLASIDKTTQEKDGKNLTEQCSNNHLGINAFVDGIKIQFRCRYSKKSKLCPSMPSTIP